MQDYIVEMKNITKKFPGVVANDNVTIQIKKGEIYAVLGENGAGKSTLMSMLFGMYEPDGGEIWIRQKKVKISSPNQAAKLNIGMVHQHFKLVSNYSVAENIILGMEPRKRIAGILPMVDLKMAEKKIKDLSLRYKLEVNPTQTIETMSVSLQQRVEILKMLYKDSEILIFDEPTAVLTPQEIDFLLQVILSLREDGKTIILITHKLEEIKKIADRCAILWRGQLIDVLDVAKTSTQTMANLMVGREVSFAPSKKAKMLGEVVLEVENLTIKNSDNFKVVDNVSFQIRKGEILAIAGVSGNGQVEIANAIAGLIHKYEGNIFLNQKNINRLSIKQKIDAGIAFVPEDRQQTGLILDFTVEENLALKSYGTANFSPKGIINRPQWETYAQEMIEKYDIRSGQGSKNFVRSMSGGNQQKIIIAREIQLAERLMVVVQPTRGLDIGAIENIHRQLFEQRDSGKAILLISLELDEIMNCADRIAIIYNGVLQIIAPADQLDSQQIGAYMMGVKVDS